MRTRKLNFLPTCQSQSNSKEWDYFDNFELLKFVRYAEVDEEKAEEEGTEFFEEEEEEKTKEQQTKNKNLSMIHYIKENRDLEAIMFKIRSDYGIPPKRHVS